MPVTVEARRKFSTPMSSSRVMVPAALLVCTVESTRWPVSEAWTAICAVSRSRISPTMMMSGSWRRIERRACANVRPILGCTWIWLTPVSWYSIGSSTVKSLLCEPLSVLSAV